MNERFPWKPILGPPLPVTPELEAYLKRQEAKMVRELNEKLYPYPGARDEAAERIRRLAEDGHG